jgi:hypothetical protein
MTHVTLRLTVPELEVLLGLAADQLFRKEFIDSRIPGCKPDIADLNTGKQLIQRLKLAAGMREPRKPATV